MNKKVISIIGVIVIAVIAVIIFGKDSLFGSKYNFDNLTVYKNSNIVNLNDEQREDIISYLSNEEFNQVNGSCSETSTYKIIFDDIEISFGSSECAYYKNNYTLENYNTIITNDLKNYVMNLTN